ncbi:hypothetical protein ES705_44673 [subsurface metagenome]
MLPADCPALLPVWVTVPALTVKAPVTETVPVPRAVVVLLLVWLNEEATRLPPVWVRMPVPDTVTAWVPFKVPVPMLKVTLLLMSNAACRVQLRLLVSISTTVGPVQLKINEAVATWLMSLVTSLRVPPLLFISTLGKVMPPELRF